MGSNLRRLATPEISIGGVVNVAAKQVTKGGEVLDEDTLLTQMGLDRKSVPLEISAAIRARVQAELPVSTN